MSTRARQAFADHDPSNVLSISTNFRSRAAILAYANRCFAQRLAEPGQPGFIALEAFRAGDDAECTVMALDVEVDPAAGQGAAEAARHGEAHAVAALCAQLIGAHMVPDRRSGESRPCRPGDIALLAPMGTELWRYEVALERLGIPVASQAGKGFYRRQEVQDLVALTRVLADSGDTVAFGALLRGPLVGLTEQELLDIVWDLPRDATAPDRLVCLDLNVDPAEVSNELARSILTALQALRCTSGQLTVFYQRGRIQAPRTASPLFSLLEDMVHEVTAPHGGAFHPKVTMPGMSCCRWSFWESGKTLKQL